MAFKITAHVRTEPDFEHKIDVWQDGVNAAVGTIHDFLLDENVERIEIDPDALFPAMYDEDEVPDAQTESTAS